MEVRRVIICNNIRFFRTLIKKLHIATLRLSRVEFLKMNGASPLDLLRQYFENIITIITRGCRGRNFPRG